MNYDPAMKVSEIRGGAEDLNMLERRILGRADGMNDGFDDAAKEFTEVVKWDISALSAEDLAVWMEVTSTLRFCAAITEEWADAVSEYKRERRRIINRWNEEAPAYEEDLEKTEVAFRFVWMETPAQKAGAALRALKEELEGEESTAYRDLDSISIDLLQDLKNGPTPEAVQRLIENGYINWSYFNLGGEVESAPVEVDPDEMAEELVDYLDDPEGYDGDITLVTAVLGNIGLAAMRSQQEGSGLSSDQVLFLTNFYEALEEAGGEDEFYPGVLGIVNRIPENPEIDEAMREKILGALGDGILALSSESVGGAYSLLPESIRNTVEGPDPDGAYPRTSWISNAQALSLMMEHANPYLRGVGSSLPTSPRPLLVSWILRKAVRRAFLSSRGSWKTFWTSPCGTKRRISPSSMERTPGRRFADSTPSTGGTTGMWSHLSPIGYGSMRNQVETRPRWRRKPLFR
ncbi:hypothetical protein PWG71_18070 [Nocardiopsis sp. N85]|uniref:hypothetical protein n=1 Tax=Nocardiopsis sp. N85 TaxID=3029400 RepID=UPI00237FAE6C|nr:hypothetical protein [Nocardiopsis sp. N85]MDE3723303.1 hypothetical protein [Nocardiopsis sp. N85]